MSITAGTLSSVSVQSNSAVVAATAVTGATGPTTYQWYRSTTTGFSPGGGNIIAGATALTLNDTGLIPNTQYFYKVVATDTGHSNDQVTYTQLAVTTAAQQLNPNQFAQAAVLGMLDQALNFNTISCQVDVSQSGNLYAGSWVKVVDSAGGVMKVVGCSAHDDEALGPINFTFKNSVFIAGQACEVSISGNVMYMYATAAISRLAQVVLDLTSPGSVGPTTGSSGSRIVGWAFDKAPAAGALFRVYIKTPSFELDS